MKEEFKWYAEQCENDELYMITFINKEDRIDHTTLDIYDSKKEEFKKYVRDKIKTVIKITRFPGIDDAVTGLILDVFELKKRIQNIEKGKIEK